MIQFEFQLPPFDHPPFTEMTKRQARQYFDWFISRIPENLAQLRAAVDSTGYDSSRLDCTDESMVYLCRWFLENAELIDVPEEEIRARCREMADLLAGVAVKKGAEASEKLWQSMFDNQYAKEPRKKITHLWHFIAIDIGIYYGECLLHRYHEKGLYWGFVTKPKNYIHQNLPIIRGIMHRAINFDERVETGKFYEAHTNPLSAGNSLIYDLVRETLNERALLKSFRSDQSHIFNLHSPGNLAELKEMDEKEASQFFAWYVDRIEHNIYLLKDTLHSSYPSKLSDKSRIDFSVDSLVYLWSWYLERVDFVAKMEEEKQEKQQVKKLIASMEVDGVTMYEGLHVLALDISIYFAEVFQRHYEDLGIEWGYVTEPKTLPYVNRPVLTGFKDPANPVMDQISLFSDLAVRVAKGERDENALVNLYHEWARRV